MTTRHQIARQIAKWGTITITAILTTMILTTLQEPTYSSKAQIRLTLPKPPQTHNLETLLPNPTKTLNRITRQALLHREINRLKSASQTINTTTGPTSPKTTLTWKDLPNNHLHLTCTTDPKGKPKATLKALLAKFKANAKPLYPANNQAKLRTRKAELTKALTNQRQAITTYTTTHKLNLLPHLLRNATTRLAQLKNESRNLTTAHQITSAKLKVLQEKITQLPDHISQKQTYKGSPGQPDQVKQIQVPNQFKQNLQKQAHDLKAQATTTKQASNKAKTALATHQKKTTRTSQNYQKASKHKAELQAWANELKARLKRATNLTNHPEAPTTVQMENIKPPTNPTESTTRTARKNLAITLGMILLAIATTLIKNTSQQTEQAQLQSQ